MIPILIRLNLGIFFHLDSMLWAELVTSLLNHHNHQCSVIFVTLVNCTLNGWIPRSIVLSKRIENLQTSSVVRCLIIDHGDGQDKYEACVFVLMFKLVVSLHNSPLREKKTITTI